MKRILVVFFATVCWLGLAGNASAQLNGGCFAPHYSTYVTDSLGADNASIIQTVEVSGYTQALNPAIYAGPQVGYIYPCTAQTNQMQTSTHTSSITNILGTAGGTFSQGPTPALNYNDYIVSITVPVADGVVLNSSTEGKVTCIVAGTIFSSGPPVKGLEIAFTRFATAGYIVDTSSPPPKRDYFVGPYCTANTSPPDWNPASPPFYYIVSDPPTVPTDVVDGKTVCGRVGTSGPWTCLPLGRYYASYSKPWPLGFCTHNP